MHSYFNFFPFSLISISSSKLSFSKPFHGDYEVILDASWPWLLLRHFLFLINLVFWDIQVGQVTHSMALHWNLSDVILIWDLRFRFGWGSIQRSQVSISSYLVKCRCYQHCLLVVCLDLVTSLCWATVYSLSPPQSHFVFRSVPCRRKWQGQAFHINYVEFFFVGDFCTCNQLFNHLYKSREMDVCLIHWLIIWHQAPFDTFCYTAHVYLCVIECELSYFLSWHWGMSENEF